MIIFLVGHALVTEMYITAIFKLKIHGNSMVTTTCTRLLILVDRLEYRYTVVGTSAVDKLPA